jgi:hypothetical protein
MERIPHQGSCGLGLAGAARPQRAYWWVLESVVLPDPASPREIWPAPESPTAEVLLSAPLRPAEERLADPAEREEPEDMEFDPVDPEDIEPEEFEPVPMDPDPTEPEPDGTPLDPEDPAALRLISDVCARAGTEASAMAAEAAAMVCSIKGKRMVDSKTSCRRPHPGPARKRADAALSPNACRTRLPTSNA